MINSRSVRLLAIGQPQIKEVPKKGKYLLLGPILESKGMHAIFQKKGKRIKGKIFKDAGKNVQNLKFWKRAGKLSYKKRPWLYMP